MKINIKKASIWLLRATILMLLAYGIDRLDLNIPLAVTVFFIFEGVVMYIDSTWFRKN